MTEPRPESAGAPARPGTAVVTGAAGGIGSALVRRLVADGHRVVATDLPGPALETLSAVTGAHAVAADLATEDGVAAAVAGAQAYLGDVDLWCGNAGVEAGRGLETSEGDWALAHDLNVMAHVRTARLLVPGWVERGRGRYVVTASAAGLLTMLGSPAYSVTKHGAVAFAEWLSATYRHTGVVVQAVCPQGVATRMYAEAGALRDLLGRDAVLTPEQVADAVAAALEHDDFLVLPHPEVATYYRGRAADTHRWLAGMNRVQQALERAPLDQDGAAG
ncbi:SDR family oxidoreductase [Nocardioides zeae]|uniref:SDR family oxidoreductase n=1 Tax=Nocardioides imazamoxiresistens TaxID=3231893 RepID=A0ABU3PXZ9_9ACTN|nr:SDR family oxidoreductase [Nocardioides zeae]MDT9594110.1 SDR family oxidoreductase [Nocardioides zeae]